MEPSLDDLEQDLRAKARTQRIVLGIVALLAVGSVVGPCVYMSAQVGGSLAESAAQRAEYSQRASAEQISTVDAALARFEAELPERSARWRATLSRDALRALPDPTLGCSHRLPMRQPHEAARHGSFNNLDAFDALVFAGRQGFPHTLARDSIPSEPPRVALARRVAQDLRQSMRREGRTEDFVASVARANALASTFWTYDVVVFADVHEPPHVDALGTSFTPGYLRGRAVLYDYARDALVCAGDVEARTVSDAVEYTAQQFHERSALSSTLNAEMDAEVERAIARGLRFGLRLGE